MKDVDKDEEYRWRTKMDTETETEEASEVGDVDEGCRYRQRQRTKI